MPVEDRTSLILTISVIVGAFVVVFLLIMFCPRCCDKVETSESEQKSKKSQKGTPYDPGLGSSLFLKRCLEKTQAIESVDPEAKPKVFDLKQQKSGESNSSNGDFATEGDEENGGINKATY